MLMHRVVTTDNLPLEVFQQSIALCSLLPRFFAGQRVSHHMLTNYFHAILAVVLAQFQGLGFLDGIDGVIRLAKASAYMQVNVFAMALHNAFRL